MTAFEVVPAAVIRRLVQLDDLVEPVAQALIAYSQGLAGSPAVSLLNLPASGEVHVKSAYLAGHALFAVKIATSFPDNTARGLSALNGLMLAFDARTGQVVAALHDESYLTDLRTAAAGGLAARVLAPREVRTVGVLGTGVQARLQVCALRAERRFEELLVWGRNAGRARRMAEDLAPQLPAVRVEVITDRRTLVERSDVIVTATGSRAPLVEGEWLRAGQHVTAVGGDDEGKLELDGPAPRRADRLIVDARTLNTKLGDVHAALQAGELSPEDVHGELGEVLSGRARGRERADELTAAKLVGLGVQDLAAVEVTLSKLRA